MITEERLVSFIRSLEPPKDPCLQEIRKEAVLHEVPIIREETEALLSFFVNYQRPEKILEVGTAVGYSAAVMAKAGGKRVKIDTIENYEPRIKEAKKNFERTGIVHQVTLHEGDATEILRSLEGPYDLIFMDAAKAQYIVWLPEVLRLLSDNGVLISDNVLQDGDVIESRFAVERRNRTIHKRMREYLTELKSRKDLSSAVIPLGDGVALTTKKREDEA